MLKINILFIFIISSFSGIAQGYNSIFPNLSGDELFEALVDEYKTTSTLNYTKARDTLFSVIYNENDSLTCVYTGHTIYVDPTLDPTQAAFMDASSDGINTEHAFPQSMGAKFGNAKSDMHHLFPTRTAVNSARGNNEYGDIEDNEALQWYFMNEKQSDIPFANEIDLYSETSLTKFEPREDHKGNIARAMFYFYTMYRDEADDANADFFENQREELCNWHISDEVDEAEWDRNIAISKYQDGKVNPFVYDCSLATRMYCPTVSCLTTAVDDSHEKRFSQHQITIAPNPAYNTTKIHRERSDEKIYVSLYDMQGTLIKHILMDSNRTDHNLDISDMAAGMYIVKFEQANATSSQLLIVR